MASKKKDKPDRKDYYCTACDWSTTNYHAVPGRPLITCPVCRNPVQEGKRPQGEGK